MAGRPTELSTRHTFDAGAGLLLGFNVRSGADIDSLGLVFLRPYTKYTDKFKIGASFQAMRASMYLPTLYCTRERRVSFGKPYTHAFVHVQSR